jgi:hypothetical protein
MTPQARPRNVLALAMVVVAPVAATTLAVAPTTAPAGAAPRTGCRDGWIGSNGNCHIRLGNGRRPGGPVTTASPTGGRGGGG